MTGQSRDTNNIWHTRHRPNEDKQKKKTQNKNSYSAFI